jgi:hypothetical protein
LASKIRLLLRQAPSASFAGVSILEWFNDRKESNDPATAGDFGDEITVEQFAR